MNCRGFFGDDTLIWIAIIIAFILIWCCCGSNDCGCGC